MPDLWGHAPPETRHQRVCERAMVSKEGGQSAGGCPTHLRHEVCGHNQRVGCVVGKDGNLSGACKHVNAHQPKQLALGLCYEAEKRGAL